MERLFIFPIEDYVLEQDAYLSQFTVRPFNYVCEMIRLQGHPTPYPAFQPSTSTILQRDARCVKIAILSYLMLSMK